MAGTPAINPDAPPSGTGCAECEAAGGWWFHLRRCAACGHIGCCDSSPSQHASQHAADSAHPLIRSFEPGEAWFWNFQTEELSYDGPPLAPPGGCHRTGDSTSTNGLDRARTEGGRGLTSIRPRHRKTKVCC